MPPWARCPATPRLCAAPGSQGGPPGGGLGASPTRPGSSTKPEKLRALVGSPPPGVRNYTIAQLVDIWQRLQSAEALKMPSDMAAALPPEEQGLCLRPGDPKVGSAEGRNEGGSLRWAGACPLAPICRAVDMLNALYAPLPPPSPPPTHLHLPS